MYSAPSSGGPLYDLPIKSLSHFLVPLNIDVTFFVHVNVIIVDTNDSICLHWKCHLIIAIEKHQNVRKNKSNKIWSIKRVLRKL